MSVLNLMLTSNYINMKEERFDSLLLREVLYKNDYIKCRTDRALIEVNKQTPKSPAVLSSILWFESKLQIVSIPCTKDASQLRFKVSTAFIVPLIIQQSA